MTQVHMLLLQLAVLSLNDKGINFPFSMGKSMYIYKYNKVYKAHILVHILVYIWEICLYA